jgi:hypothetical protein
MDGRPGISPSNSESQVPDKVLFGEWCVQVGSDPPVVAACCYIQNIEKALALDAGKKRRDLGR